MSPQVLERHLAAHRRTVERALRALLKARPGRPARLGAAMRYAVLGPGKRIRPVLALSSAEVIGGAAAVRHAVPFACALEMIHAYSLVHDDLPAMDDDDERRGRPSLHVEFDEALAILTGDALLTEAFAVIADAARAARGEAVRRALTIVSEVAAASGADGMVAGQVVDLASEGARRRAAAHGDRDPPQQDRCADPLRGAHRGDRGGGVAAPAREPDRVRRGARARLPDRRRHPRRDRRARPDRAQGRWRPGARQGDVSRASSASTVRGGGPAAAAEAACAALRPFGGGRTRWLRWCAMSSSARLDVTLFARGLAESRERAQRLIMAGCVLVNGERARHAGKLVREGRRDRRHGSGHAFVSRGGVKLAGALDAFALDVSGSDLRGRRRLDRRLHRLPAAARRGPRARGRRRLRAARLEDPHRSARARARAHQHATLWRPDARPGHEPRVVDASFISLRLLLAPTLAQLVAPARIVALVKPQFEVGREGVGKGGVVRDAGAREAAVASVAAAAQEIGLEVLGSCVSPLPGAKKGNVELFLDLAARSDAS